MFNPYFSQVQDVLRMPEQQRPTSPGGFSPERKALDGDRLLLLLLIVVLLQEGRQEEYWPLILALIYCMM